MARRRTPRMPQLPKWGSLPRPPRDRSRLPVAPKGPRIYHRGSEPLHDSLYMHPPDGFVTPHTSAPEWMFYLALAVLTGKPKDATIPPFIGGPPLWTYQKFEQGGSLHASGSITDFVVLDQMGTGEIGIRIETERFHIWTDGATQQKDLYILAHLSSVQKIVRVWDQYFIDDPSGEKVCRIAAMALRGQEMPSPISLGIAQRVRP